jgi:hypothetical protein
MANTVFENKVIEAKAKDLLVTEINARSLMTIDNSLVETEGMTKTINVYTYTGKVEKLADGAKNTTRGSIAYVGTDYKVERAQQVFDYYDSDFMKDNNVVDMSLKGANELMVNEMTADFITEASKATEKEEFTGDISYDVIVDAISRVGLEKETELFLVLPNAWKAALRKDADYKAARMGEVVYGGAVNTIAGIPVIFTNALEDTGFVMTKEAVKLFMKKDVEVEQDRDIETKLNTVVLATYYICALVNNNKICKIVKTA